MTQVITRYFESAARARMAKKDLIFISDFSPRIIDLYEGADAAEHMAKNNVDPATITAYAEKLAHGGAVILVRAGFRPLGVAQTTRDMLDALSPADMGDLVEEVRVKDDPTPPSVYTDHRLVMTRIREPGDTNFYMANWPIPLISRRKPYTGSLLADQHGRMADVFWPLTIRNDPYTWMLFDEHARMADWPIGLISKRKPFDGFAFPRHSRMANFILPLLSQRKPYTGSIIAKHARMANWPFPLLINGKQGTNSLVPGHKYMAKFPFAHIVPGHKYMAKFPIALLVPGHRFMAKFPFAHIVPGHRFMAKFPFAHLVPGHRRMASWPIGLLVPGHKRMANMFLPLTIKHRKQMD